jgi:UDP-N-acetylglucosamine diphosphorylase/glucosamine-1-phosphate N-acetyltransferase
MRIEQSRRENVAVVILAAGLGTRMKSSKAKVLHEIAGKPMILYVVETASKVAGADVVLVVGHQADQVRDLVSREFEALFAIQPEQRGTGHAVQCALPALPPEAEQVVILCGDVPLITTDTITALIDDHVKLNRDVSMVAVKLVEPSGYGRVLQDGDGGVVGIIEEADATPTQRRINTVNSGIYCVKRQVLEQCLSPLRADNVQGELYLTDIVGIAHGNGLRVGALISEDEKELKGVNTLDDLARVTSILSESAEIA